jgi:site-specific recombinase XerD
MKHNRRVILWKVPGSFIRRYLMIRISQRARGSDPFLVSYNWSKPKGRRLTSAAIDRLIKNLAKGAKIRKAEIHAHMFRATHANDLQQIRGYTLPAIMERLGWLDLSTAGRYLVRRERVHREYSSLHEYWKEFSRIWRKEEGTNDVNAPGDNGGDAAAAPYAHGGGAIEKALQ